MVDLGCMVVGLMMMVIMESTLLMQSMMMLVVARMRMMWGIMGVASIQVTMARRMAPDEHLMAVASFLGEVMAMRVDVMMGDHFHWIHRVDIAVLRVVEVSLAHTGIPMGVSLRPQGMQVMMGIMPSVTMVMGRKAKRSIRHVWI